MDNFSFRSFSKEGILIAFFCLGMALKSGAKQVEAIPQRIVSANLCTDQMSWLLANQEQIKALSILSEDEKTSYIAKKVKNFPKIGGSLEEILQFQPDFVLLGAYDKLYKQHFLKQLQIPYYVLRSPKSLEEGKYQIILLAYLVGQEERGKKFVAQLEKALERLKKEAFPLRTFLFLQRGGYSPSQEDFVQDILNFAGLEDIRNFSPLSSSKSWNTYLGLEEILSLHPDYLLFSGRKIFPHFFRLKKNKENKEGRDRVLGHPALTRFYPLKRRLLLPENLTLCFGPATLGLIEYLRKERRQLFP